MNFHVLLPALDARLNGALSRAHSKIKAAEVIAEQVRAEAREKSSRCRNERLASEILEDDFADARRHVQETHRQVACESLSDLIGIQLAATDHPAELARELERGLPGSIREQIEAVVPLTPSTLRVLGVAIEQHYQKCWEQVERNGPVPGPAKNLGVAGAFLQMWSTTHGWFLLRLSVAKNASPQAIRNSRNAVNSAARCTTHVLACTTPPKSSSQRRQ